VRAQTNRSNLGVGFGANLFPSFSLAKPSIKTTNDLLSHPTLCLHVQPCRAYPHPWKVLLSCSICCSQVQCELRHGSIKW